MKKYLIYSAALAMVALASCQEEDLGFSREEVALSAYERNFENQFGTISETQDWDFYRQALDLSLTRAGEAIIVGSLQTGKRPGGNNNTIINSATNKFPDRRNNKDRGELAGAMSNSTENPITFEVYTVQYGGGLETSAANNFHFGIEANGVKYNIFDRANSKGNPQNMREVTIPANTDFRFYIEFDRKQSEEKCLTCNLTGKVNPDPECTTCHGTGVVSCRGDLNAGVTHGLCGCRGTKVKPCSCTKDVCPSCHGNRSITYTEQTVHHTIYSDGTHCVIASQQANVGNSGTQTVLVLAFEDMPENTWGEDPDWDFNDFMVCIMGTIPEVQGTKRFFFEDLTQSQSTRDAAWDFNDLVIDVQSTLSNGTNVKIQAVGGTLPIKLYINGELVKKNTQDGELHAEMGVNDYTQPINVGGTTAQAITFNLPDLEFDGSNPLANFTNVKISVSEDEGANWRDVTFQAPGEAARVFAVPSNVRWMKEDKNIKSGYAGFWRVDQWYNSVTDPSLVY